MPWLPTLHKTVIAVRSAIKCVDRNTLAAFASGKQNIVKKYDDALAQDDNYLATTGLLTRQKSALLAKIAEMEAMEQGGQSAGLR